MSLRHCHGICASVRVATTMKRNSHYLLSLCLSLPIFQSNLLVSASPHIFYILGTY